MQIPRDPKDVLKFQLSRSISNIEDALTEAGDPELFLSASVAFLQRYIHNKMTEPFQKPLPCDRDIGSYSDLLIFDVNEERCFVRVKNVEKYDRIMKKEAAIPSKALSLDQLLPKPKKAKKKRSSLLSLFRNKTLSKISFPEGSNLQRTLSIFTLFKRVPKIREGSKELVPIADSRTIAIDCRRSNISSESKITCSTSTSTSSLRELPSSFIKPISSSTVITMNEHPIRKSTAICSLKLKNPGLSKEELDIINNLPGHPKSYLKKSLSETREYNKRSKRRSIYSSSSRDSNLSGLSLQRQASSKLSVCMEDEFEEDEETLSRSDGSEYSCNLTDEVKSNFSPEAIDIIMRRLIQYFEYNPDTKCKCNKK